MIELMQVTLGAGGDPEFSPLPQGASPQSAGSTSPAGWVRSTI